MSKLIGIFGGLALTSGIGFGAFPFFTRNAHIKPWKFFIPATMAAVVSGGLILTNKIAHNSTARPYLIGGAIGAAIMIPLIGFYTYQKWKSASANKGTGSLLSKIKNVAKGAGKKIKSGAKSVAKAPFVVARGAIKQTAKTIQTAKGATADVTGVSTIWKYAKYGAIALGVGIVAILGLVFYKHYKKKSPQPTGA